MPYRTPYGTHYHMTEGCCGATEACGSTEGLAPCSICCGVGGGNAAITASEGGGFSIVNSDGDKFPIRTSADDDNDGRYPRKSDFEKWQKATEKIANGEDAYANATIIADKIIAARDLLTVVTDTLSQGGLNAPSAADFSPDALNEGIKKFLQEDLNLRSNLFGKLHERFSDSECMLVFGSFTVDDIKAYTRCVEEEPEITKTLSRLCNLIGLKYNIKSPSSVLRKIHSIKGSVSDLCDVVRYTHMSEPDALASDTAEILEKLQEEGYEVLRFKNTWGDPLNPYKGINVRIQKKGGIPFELQFHTQESFDLKDGEMHRLYEKARVLPNGSPERVELERQMLELSKTLTRPRGIEELTPEKVIRKTDAPDTEEPSETSESDRSSGC